MTALVAALASAFTIGQLTTGASSASAATVPVTGGIQAQMSGHVGYTLNGSANPTTSDDYRYGTALNRTTSGEISNTGGSNGTNSYPSYRSRSDGYTAWVNSGSTAWTAHGLLSRSGGDLNLSNQSALGFAPASVASITPGQLFNVGRMAHSNNPVSAANEYFRGSMNVKLLDMQLQYQWQMHETPNDCSGKGCSDDFVNFLNQISDQTFTYNGMTYTLVIAGFTEPQGNNNTCLPTPSDVGGVINQFRTKENTVTYGCLYASIQQIRPLTIVKQAEAPYGAPDSIPSFSFDSSSNLAGSPWATDFTLRPSAVGSSGTASVTHDFVVGQTVKITEANPTSPWGFTSLQCSDGVGNPVGSVNGNSLTLSGDLSTTDPDAARITCTYVNTYTPNARLTVMKNVQGRLAPADQFTLTAAKGMTQIATATTSGTATGLQDQKIDAVPVFAGQTYSIGEAMAPGSVSSIGEYGSGWECLDNNGKSIATGNKPQGEVAVPSSVTGQSRVEVTCVFTNTPLSTPVTISKTVKDAAGKNAAPGKDWTVGLSAKATSGTVTPITPATQNTDAKGTASWTIRFGTSGSSAEIAVHEDQKPGWKFVSGQCVITPLAGDPRTVTLTGAAAQTVPGIKPGDRVACGYVNQPLAAELTLVKQISLGDKDLADQWKLSADGPSDALPGPRGITGSTTATALVTPGKTYALSEELVDGADDATALYAQAGEWQCRAGDQTLPVTDGAVAIPASADQAKITCTVTNATALLTILKHVQDAEFAPSDWTLKATPDSSTWNLPTKSVKGADTDPQNAPQASTVEVRPGTDYTLSETYAGQGATPPYLQLSLEKWNAESNAWEPVLTGAKISVAPGEHAYYRFVNSEVPAVTLPLTGGLGTQLFLALGGGGLLIALALLVVQRRRKARTNRA